MDVVGWLTYILVIVGAINWGLYGIDPNYDLVATLLGGYTMAARAVYILVGASGIINLVSNTSKM